MILSVNVPESLASDVRVDLRRRYIGVTKHHLYRPQVGPPLEKVCRERVSERMGIHLLVEFGLSNIFLDNLPEPLTRESATRPVQEKIIHRSAPGQSLSRLPGIAIQAIKGRLSDGDDSLLVPLPHNDETPRIPVQYGRQDSHQYYSRSGDSGRIL